MNKKIALGIAYFFPFLVFAQQTLTGILNIVGGIFRLVIPFIITLALIYFLWGVATYIMNSGDEEARKTSRAVMIHGIIALFVIISVWGLVAILNSTFGINAGGGAAGVPIGPF